jgi:hypothetical protein
MKGRDQLRDLGVDNMIILKWILKKQGVMMWTGSSGLRKGVVTAYCVNGN